MSLCLRRTLAASTTARYRSTRYWLSTLRGSRTLVHTTGICLKQEHPSYSSLLSHITDVMHCFEIRTANVDYRVGVDPLSHVSALGGAPLPPPESGVGAYLARSWETALRHALMPVTAKQPHSGTVRCGLWGTTAVSLYPHYTVSARSRGGERRRS